jgi:hypothetical protein
MFEQAASQRSDLGLQVTDLVTQLSRGLIPVSSHVHHLAEWWGRLL